MMLKIIGNRLRLIRKYKGMTQVELAEKVGIGQNLVSYAERGEREKTTVLTIIKMCEGLGVSPAIVMLDQERIDLLEQLSIFFGIRICDLVEILEQAENDL